MVWLQMTQIKLKKPKEKEYLLLAKAEKSRNWASNRADLGAQIPHLSFPVFSSFLVEEHL